MKAQVQDILKRGAFIICNSTGFTALTAALLESGEKVTTCPTASWFELAPNIVVKVDDTLIGTHEPKFYVVDRPTLPAFHEATFVHRMREPHECN